MTVGADLPGPGSPAEAPGRSADQDALLRTGRALLYPGLALSSLLVFRGPAELPIGDILIAVAGICGLLSLHRPGRGLPASTRFAGALVLVGGLLAATVSSDAPTSLSITARLLYMVAIIPAILLTLLVEQRHVVKALMWWLAGAGVCGLGAVVQLTLGDVIPGGDITLDARYTGFTTHPSDLAGVTVTAVGATLAALTGTLSRRTRNWAMAIVVACAVGLLFSGSVSGMFGLIGAVGYLFVRRAIPMRRATVLGVGGALLVAVVVGQLTAVGALNPVERFLRTTGYLTTQSEHDTAATRIELASRALDGIADSPWLGHGMVTLDNVLYKAFTVHNNLLASWHAGGVLVFAGVLLATAVALRYCTRRDVDDAVRNIVGAAVVGAFVFAQTAPGTYNRYYWMPIAFMIVVEVRARARRRGTPFPDGGQLPGTAATVTRV